jgi:hypothetical protein
MEYRMTILRYVLAMADNIMSGTCPLTAQSHLEYRLLVEFFWMLHKIPEYLVRTDREDCCNKLKFLGEQKAGLQELWNELGKDSAGVQTMQRRMMLQLGFLEREGCIRLDQVRNSPTNAEMNQAYLAASDEVAGLKEAPNEQFQNRAYVISEELGQALKKMAKGTTPKAEAQTRRERSPSIEMVEAGARTAGKGKEEGRQQKRAREDRTSAREERGSAQVVAKQTLVLPKPEYMLVSPEEWQHRRQRDGTYRYDHQKWREDLRDPWGIHGSKIEGLRKGGTMWLRIPSVVQVCRKVTGKSQAYEIYVPLPPDGEKGTILQLNSMSKLEDLCYNVGDMAMFMPEADLQGVDIVKKWHDDPKSRVTDLEEALKRLQAYVDSRGDEQPDIDVYGTATEAAQREQDEEKRRQAERVQVRTVEQDTAFTMAYVELAPEEEPSVSAPTLSGAAQAASHPNVTHLTDSLVRMGYLEDLHKGVSC